MKKSFMTRALATGLSLAMAFSLTAVSNVSTASAAADPAMNSKTMTVKVGQSKNFKATKATRSDYKIVKTKMSKAGKTKADVSINKGGKSIKVTGKAATKKSNLVITFKNRTTKEKTTVTTKVVVKDDKLTMTAEATGVKKITVNFNKAVDTTTAKIVVKKGAATPTIASTTFAADAKSAEIVMGTKLTEGTYTVQATVGEETLTADIVTKDETLTSFALVSKNLVATAADKSVAKISYKALNQYGEMMPADNVSTPTCSFGKVATGDYTNPTADKSGTITVKDIPDVLAVVGTTGTLVLVDSSTGVTLNETVTYQSKAVAAKATVYGIYNTKTDKLIEGNLKTGDTIRNYQILVNIQDQYDADMTPKNIEDSDCKVSFNPASILTDVTLTNTEIASGSSVAWEEMTYDGKNCILLPLEVTNGSKIVNAGTLNMTMVSANKGVLATPSFTISDAVMIQSLSISAKDTVYGGQDNELVVEAVDTNGNAVTKYDDLKASIECQAGVTLKKNADGTGTFWYNPGDINGSSNDKWKKNELKTLIFKANAPASGNYIVKSVNVTVYAKRLGWKVSGVTADTTTATALSEKLAFNLKTLTFEDQYANSLKYSDSQVSGAAIAGYLDDPKQIFGSSTGSAVTFTPDKDGNYQYEFNAPTKKGSATLYLRYINDEVLAANVADPAKEDKKASAEKYDLKITLSAVDVEGVVANDLKVKINDGNAIYGVAKASLEMSESNDTVPVTTAAFKVTVVVTATVNGKTVVIPASQCTIIDGKTLGDYGAVQAVTNPAKTEEKTVTVVVDSEEGPQTVTGKVTVSNADPAVTTVKAADTKDISGVTSGAAINSEKLFGTIKVLNQYGSSMNNASDIVYTLTFTGTSAAYQSAVTKNGTQEISVALPGGTYNANVKYVVGGKEFNQDIKITVNS